MEYKYYIGADIAKHTLDFTILKDGDFLMHETINNTKHDIQEWLKAIMATYKAGGKKSLFCVENTGTYQAILVKEILRRKAPLWLETPLQIHLSLGLQRGKSDKLDSRRIAEYAYTHRKKVKLWLQPREVIEQLKQLRSLRERLVTARRQLKQETEELKGFVKNSLRESVLGHCQGSLTALQKDLVKVNQTIVELITTDQRLCELFEWLTSVVGIGKVLATEMIITTNEFKSFSTAKKYACHCGVAPFPRSSGTDTHKKAKVSKMANKRIRKLLHIAAMSAIRSKGEYQEYYQRRVKQGLNKTSVLNAIRNKIIRRAFACVREQRCYVK